MTRGEIRQHVRDILGDPGPYGMWSDDELNRHLTLVSDRHAQEGLSAPAEIFTNSIRGVDEYQLPDDYAEMIRVWYLNEHTNNEKDKLFYIKKSTLDQYRGVVSTGQPRYYTLFNDRIILYPTPSPRPVLSKGFDEDTGANIRFANIRDVPTPAEIEADPSLVRGGILYNFDFEVELEELDESDNAGALLTPALANVAHISLYMRRRGPSVDGQFTLGFSREGYPTHWSQWKDLAGLSNIPGWVHFDFTENPIEFFKPSEAEDDNFTLRFDDDAHVNTPYADVLRDGLGGAELAIDDDGAPFFEMYALQNDIIIEYYRNSVRPLVDDDDVSEIPDRYHRTLVDMVIARACEKDGFNMMLANQYHAKTQSAIRYARMQAKQATLDDVINTDHISDASDFITYRDGRLVGRAW